MAKTLANYDPLVQIPSGMTPAGADFPIVESHDILVGENDKRLDAKLDDIDSAIGNVGQTPIATQLSSKVNTSDIQTTVRDASSASDSKIPSEKAVRSAIDSKTINVDSTVTEGSTNAVSGGAVHTQLATKQDALTFDTTPTASSSNPVTSGGVKTALDAKQDALTFDTTPTASSSNPVTSGGVKTALDAKQDALTFDTTPTASSSNPVTSGGVKTALDAKQDALTFDTTPTASSSNPVTSGGVKTALDNKQNTLTYETTPIVGSVNPVTSTGIRNAIDTAAAQNLGAMQAAYDTFSANISARVSSLSNGMVACSNIAAETTVGDTRILLYTGTTNANYTNGHWYYNSAPSNAAPSWTDGGAVGSAPTIDNTLTVEGAAANSKAVGDAIENIVTISNTQPGSNSGNKVWIKETTSEEVQIPTYAEHIAKANKADIATNNESDNGSGTITASKKYAIGDHFYINNTNTSSENYGVSTLYKATAAIASGDAIVVGTNCEASKVADEITSLSNDIDTVKADLGKHISSDDLIFVNCAMGENGTVYNVLKQSTLNRIISAITPVRVLSGSISCSSLYKFRVAYYTSNEISYEVAPSNFVKFSPWVSDETYFVESGYYIVILAGKSDNSNISNVKDVSSNLNISLEVAPNSVEYLNVKKEKSTNGLWTQGLISATSGNLESNNYRIILNSYIPSFVDAVYSNNPLLFRLLAWDADDNFVGIYKQNGAFEKSTTNLANIRHANLNTLRKTFPNYHFKIYAFASTSSNGVAVNPTEGKSVYFIENLINKSLENTGRFFGKKVAILGDSISTNGNSGIDANVPEITIQAEDVGVELSAYVTYYDVQAGLSLGGHTFTSSEIGTEVTFTPTNDDIGKSIGLANNYNDNKVVTWWEVLQNELCVKCIPNTWSGASITSHEASTNTRKCSYAWHESQIRKCGIRIAGTMNRTAPDIIIIYRGTNDMTHQPYTLLTDDYFDSFNWSYPETDVVANGYGYKEGLCLTIKKLRDTYPNAKIFLCTLNVFKRINYSHFPTNNGINSLPQYNEAIREVANFMGCGIIEFDKDGITFENCYSQGYITDSATMPTHPNDKGHKVMGLKAIADLQSQYSEVN